ncbi:MAG: molybdenum cofactor biosynthesis protein MoaE [Cyclobacteriaceae bacterium]|nr:molybdenum cofactor biosynthesis protein MoaE [Cyclobacteriaceae bacterium]
MILLDQKPLNIQQAIDHVSDPSVGGIDVFIGTVRNTTHGKQVVALDFEAYEKMAISELAKIADAARKKWPVEKIAIMHALGRKAVGELAVVIAVSAAHRDAAFGACRFIIDSLKQTVPIWKKEVFADGEVWVMPHP